MPSHPDRVEEREHWPPVVSGPIGQIRRIGGDQPALTTSAISAGDASSECWGSTRTV